MLLFKPATEDYARLMATNLEACFHLSQLAHPLLVSNGGGSVVHISSIASITGYPWEALYSTTKGGLNQLTRSLAAEWASDKIRFVSVHARGVLHHRASRLRRRWPDHQCLTSIGTGCPDMHCNYGLLLLVRLW